MTTDASSRVIMETGPGTRCRRVTTSRQGPKKTRAKMTPVTLILMRMKTRMKMKMSVLNGEAAPAVVATVADAVKAEDGGVEAARAVLAKATKDRLVPSPSLTRKVTNSAWKSTRSS